MARISNFENMRQLPVRTRTACLLLVGVLMGALVGVLTGAVLLILEFTGIHR